MLKFSTEQSLMEFVGKLNEFPYTEEDLVYDVETYELRYFTQKARKMVNAVAKKKTQVFLDF